MSVGKYYIIACKASNFTETWSLFLIIFVINANLELK